MSRYLIHTMPDRLYYVETYLIPSMMKQGIGEVEVYNDEKREGNLESWLKSCEQLDNEGGTWHLQDDVLICRDFKQRTEELDKGIVCGFGSMMYDKGKKSGKVTINDSFWSFPCIRIPNNLAKECANWIRSDIIGNPVYVDYWKTGANDDWCFKTFINTLHPKTPILNLSPTLVEHVDYLIGGGTGKKRRTQPCKSICFEDSDLVEELRLKLRAEERRLSCQEPINVFTADKIVWSGTVIST